MLCVTLTGIGRGHGQKKKMLNWLAKSMCKKGRVEHKKYYLSYKRHVERQVFFWTWPAMQLGQGQNDKYVQFIS